MLKEFEAKKESLHVSSYGLSVTSLEEVFMKYVYIIIYLGIKYIISTLIDSVKMISTMFIGQAQKM